MFISCTDKKRTKETDEGSAPRNPLRRPHFKDAAGPKQPKNRRLCDKSRSQRLWVFILVVAVLFLFSKS